MLKFFVAIAITINTFAASYHVNSEDKNSSNNVDGLNFNEANSNNITVSLNQFTIFKKLGKGASGTVFLVKKNGGTDDGTLYALKAIDISYALYYDKSRPLKTLVEREVLEAIRGIPFTTGLHYAFRQRQWTFLVMDFGIGGDVQTRLDVSLPDETKTQLILAEIIVAIEQMHNVNLFHGDVAFQNVLIDGNGHIMFTDFGFSSWLNSNDDTVWDWKELSMMGPQIFGHDIDDENKISLIALLSNMTDTKLPELKRHPYFNGIDWEKVARKESDAPFEPSVQLDLNDPLDIDATLQFDDEITANLIERFKYYSFVAPEHQN